MDASCYIPNNPDFGLKCQCWEQSFQAPERDPAVAHEHDAFRETGLQCSDINISVSTNPALNPLACPEVLHQQRTEEEPATVIVCWPEESHPPPAEHPQHSDLVADNDEEDEDMGSFSMPLDLDPLPALFPFSPCNVSSQSAYKTEATCSPLLHHQAHAILAPKEKPVQDMADVLLSLKHAVVHPGQTGPGDVAYHLQPQHQQQQHHHHHHQQQQQPLSYTVHPHQMLMSPNGYTTYCDQLPTAPPPSANYLHHQPSSGASMQMTPGPPSAMFPSMSVNVSMNMTYHPTTLPTYDQMQWTTIPPQATSSSGYVQNQNGVLSPGYPPGGATYSFTADFRPQGNVQEVPLITTTSFKPVLNSKTQQFSMPMKTRKMAYVNGGRLQMVYEDDDMQKPNLCRICGKTYARPSTLKTHLRTHSGEKPYRCIDCNKSFSQAANLTAHVRTHSGEKPFRCPICDRRFSQSSSVTTHMRTHSGERPYRCRMCKKAFSDSSTLTKHLRIHSGEKPYQCKLCLLRFSQSGNLNRHMRVHGGASASLPHLGNMNGTMLI